MLEKKLVNRVNVCPPKEENKVVPHIAENTILNYVGNSVTLILLAAMWTNRKWLETPTTMAGEIPPT